MAYYTEEAGRELREAFEQRTLHWPLVTVRRMFGCPAYLADGKLFAFLVSDGIVITQVRKHDRERLEATFSIAPFTAVRCCFRKPGVLRPARIPLIRKGLPVSRDKVNEERRICPPPSPIVPSIVSMMLQRYRRSDRGDNHE